MKLQIKTLRDFLYDNFVKGRGDDWIESPWVDVEESLKQWAIAIVKSECIVQVTEESHRYRGLRGCHNWEIANKIPNIKRFVERFNLTEDDLK